MRTAWLVLAALVAVAMVVAVMLGSVSDRDAEESDAESLRSAPRAPEDLPPPLDDSAPPGNPVNPEADLGGRVLSPEDRPVAGAQVLVYGLREGVWLDAATEDPRRLVLTDGAGRFGVADALSGSYAFEARAAGYAPGFAVVRSFVMGRRTRVTLKLAEEVTISGRTLDTLGEPVPGARIILEPALVVREFQRTAKGLKGLVLPGRVEVLSDGDGRFLIERIGPGIYDLVVQAKGMIRATLYAVHAPAEGVEVFLRQGLAVRGTISWGDGEPPGGIKVWTDPFDQRGVVVVKEERADFEIDGLPAGVYDVMAWGSGCAETKARVVLERGSAAPTLELHLAPGTVLSGTVTDIDTGRPIPNVVVRFTREGQVESAVTDERGAYRVVLTPGQWVSSVEKDGYLDPIPRRLWTARGARLTGEITVRDQPMGKNFRLRARYSISGRVLYPDGSPASAYVSVTSARVRTDVRNPPSSQLPRGRGVRTAKDGCYEIEGIVPWAVYTVRAAAGKDNVTEIEDVVFSDGEREAALPDMTVEYPPGGPASLEALRPATVRGRVVTEKGEPIAGAVVSIGGSPGSTGVDGRFEIPNAGPGSSSVLAVAPGFAPTVFEPVDLVPGEVLELRDLVLPLRGVALAGRILDTSARPIPGAIVRVRFKGMEGAFETVSDAEGIYELEGPSAPIVHVSVEAEAKGFIPGVVHEAAVRERVIDVTLRRHAILTAQLSYSGERPGTLVISYGSPWSRKRKAVEAELDEDGRTLWCEEMPLGQLHLRLEAGGFAPMELGKHNFLEGKTTSLGAVKLLRGGTIEGRIVARGAYRQWRFDVLLVNPPERVPTDAEGRFRFENVPAGEHHLCLYQAGGSHRYKRFLVKVTNGKTSRVAIKFP
ncbi:MAG: carboxypeptidase-like regulatory domain-containing protein [Planctomycetota bacterium]|jgi:protocatechuate 3,4-dioxygenase beta subunit